MKALFVAFACVAIVMAALSCSPRPKPVVEEKTPLVRVRILQGVDRVTLALDAPPQLYSQDGQAARRIASSVGQAVSLTCRDDRWLINSADAGVGTLTIEPSAVGSMRVEGIAYRGSFRFVPVGGGKFDVVNDVDVESYLMGVLARELFSDWQPETYKAQAIIARTYALYEAASTPSGRYWDLYPDERSQMYGGMKGETPKAAAAVQATRGEVVVYGPAGREKIFKTYFSSCCGGVSTDVADAFGEPNIPPLMAQSRGATCSISTRFIWPAVTISKEELARRLHAWAVKQNNALASAAGVSCIDVSAVNAFGRPRGFVVTDSNGKQFPLVGEQLRWAINTDAKPGTTVFSNFFRPVDSGSSITFSDGHGFGHGVGACQWCMEAKARGGETARRIAIDEYSQSSVVTAY